MFFSVTFAFRFGRHTNLDRRVAASTASVWRHLCTYLVREYYSPVWVSSRLARARVGTGSHVPGIATSRVCACSRGWGFRVRLLWTLTCWHRHEHWSAAVPDRGTRHHPILTYQLGRTKKKKQKTKNKKQTNTQKQKKTEKPATIWHSVSWCLYVCFMTFGDIYLVVTLGGTLGSTCISLLVVYNSVIRPKMSLDDEMRLPCNCLISCRAWDTLNLTLVAGKVLLLLASQTALEFLHFCQTERHRLS